MAKQSRSRDRSLRFRFLGWRGGWYMLRLATRRLEPLAVNAHRTEIVAWLFEQEITLNDLSYLSNGNTGDGPVVPAMDDGFALCLLFRRAADVMRFHLEFDCRDFTPQTLFDAVRGEASVHKFVMADIAFIAYDAIRRFVLVFGDDFPEWFDLEEGHQQLFLQLVREYLEHPDWTAERLHEAWLDTRRIEGWRYSPEVDLDNKLHPSMVPFAKLPDREQAQTRLTASVIASLAPLLRRV
jgi:hypothetical protein